MTSADIPILPCPFCGYHAAVMYHWIHETDTPGPCYVQCENGGDRFMNGADITVIDVDFGAVTDHNAME